MNGLDTGKYVKCNRVGVNHQNSFIFSRLMFSLGKYDAGHRREKNPGASVNKLKMERNVIFRNKMSKRF